MLSRLFRLATRSRAAVVRPATVAVPRPVPVGRPRPISPAGPGVPVKYHPALIAELVAEHRQLLGAYAEIGDILAAQAWDRVGPHLERIRTLLMDHLLKEGVRLYVYLEREFPDDTARSLYRQFKTEMAGLGTQVIGFTNRYGKPGSLHSDRQRHAFAVEYEVVGKVLADRLQREESQLYPLYV